MTANRLAVLFSLVVALAGCSQEPEQKPEVIRPVLSVVVEPRTNQVDSFVGSVEPRISAALAFRLLGRVVSREVKVGDIVAKGTTIATLDSVALELAVQAAQADLSSAEAQFANASASEERQRTLLEQGNTSQAIYDTAKQARDAAQSNVERAKAAAAKAEEQLGYARLFSDFDGVVTAVGAEVGQTVAAGQMIVTVARSDEREAVVDIPEQIAAGLKEGATFDVILQSLPTIRTKGTVREVAPQADASTRTQRVRLSLAEPPAAFRLGSTVTAIRATDVTPYIELPLSALLEKDGKTSVWVVDPAGTVTLRDVQVGTRTANSFVCASGLEAGTRVVTAGVHSLEAGQRVRLPDGAEG